MSLTLYITGKCEINCAICCQHGELRFNYASPHTPAQLKGLEKLIRIHNGGEVQVTGGDPLLNPEALELISLLDSPKTVMVNPISFLKPNTDVQRMIQILARYTLITLSNGSLQGPNPELATDARVHFRKAILPELRKRNPALFLYENPVRGSLENGEVCHADNLSLVGKLRQDIEHGTISGSSIFRAKTIEFKVSPCNSSLYTDAPQIYHFEQAAEGTQIMRAVCCQVTKTPYTSRPTGLTLESLGEMQDPDAQLAMDKAERQFKAGGLCAFLAGHDESFTPDVKFGQFTQLAGEIIQGKLGRRIDLVGETYVLDSSEADSCSVCNTIGVYLARAGIKPGEWQQYLAENLDKI